MTNDYKERVIKWLTGNYEIEQSSTEPLFKELEKTQTTLNTYIYKILDYIQGKDKQGNDLNIGFIYGNDSHNKGVILVVDGDFNILQVITKYNTGTDFNKFICLNVDRINGNIYGIDLQGSQYRFILLNNFLIKNPNQINYEVKLRNSYFLNFTHNKFVPSYVEKRPSDSFYVITGMSTDDTIDNQPMIATYKIEVGAANELNEYVYTDVYTGYLSLKTYNIAWSGENYIEKIACINFEPDNSLYKRYLNIYEFNGTTITRTLHKQFGSELSNPSGVDSYQEVELTNNDIYICYNFDLTSDSRICKLENNEFVEYFSIEGDYTLDYTYTGIRIKKSNNTIYFYGYENTTSGLSTDDYNFNLYFGVITNLNGTPYTIYKSFEAGQIYNLVIYKTTDVFSVSSLYNLTNYHLLNSNSTIMASVKQIFNSLNYNYNDYQDINSLLPNSAWLYNDNKIIYARNLYNKTINGNTTIATLEVPNLMLNDIDIEQQDLLGQTNGTLITNTDTIQKNIYEDLFINFYNTLTMQNQNTPNYITNLNGSTRLNNSISASLDYENVLISKIKINYTDETSTIKGITKAIQVSQFVYNFNFQIYVDKPILNIELISNDENTVYQTINLTTQVGKYYNINQQVEIGG
jgi:hypothetical protein